MAKKVGKTIEVGIIGNPNTGKSSLFNSLTGASQHVGNWPGKTVERKAGRFEWKGYTIKIVDLPGTYSIVPYTEEERVAKEYIASGKPEVVIQTVDANALARNLFLTFEIASLGEPVILAFNFNKEARQKGAQYNTERIEEKLQIPIVEIEANTGEGNNKLLDKIVELHKRGQKLPSYISGLSDGGIETISHHKSHQLIAEALGKDYRPGEGCDRTCKIDRFLLNKYSALPIFFLVLWFVFQATFTISSPLVDLVGSLFGSLAEVVSSLLSTPALPGWVSSLIVDGVIDGVGSVVTFFPLIFTLFLLIALLEDSGYFARTVFLADKLFEKLGLTGSSFIPMILGFGCNVPAIMATRIIKNTEERLISILVNPFISCSARLSVYVLFAGIFFEARRGLVIMSLYVLGVLAAFVSALVLGRVIPGSSGGTLILELPPYRLPTLKNIFLRAWTQAREFLRKAGTVIFAAVLVIWLLANLPVGVEYGSRESFLGHIGRVVAPLFIPLGFGGWTFAVALMSGFVAKEVVIGTLGTLYGVGEEGLSRVLPTVISPSAALAFMVFVLLYVPCIATVAVIKRETGSWKWPILQIAASTVIAWVAAFATFRLANGLGI